MNRRCLKLETFGSLTSESDTYDNDNDNGDVEPSEKKYLPGLTYCRIEHAESELNEKGCACLCEMTTFRLVQTV